MAKKLNTAKIEISTVKRVGISGTETIEVTIKNMSAYGMKQGDVTVKASAANQATTLKFGFIAKGNQDTRTVSLGGLIDACIVDCDADDGKSGWAGFNTFEPTNKLEIDLR